MPKTDLSGRGVAATESSANDGRATYSMGKGQTMSVDYGKDHSSLSGRGERDGKMGGSITNLSHSLSGSSANLKGK